MRTYVLSPPSFSSVSSAERPNFNPSNTTESVLMYVKAVDYSSVKYLAVLSRPDNGENSVRDFSFVHWWCSAAVVTSPLHVLTRRTRASDSPWNSFSTASCQH